MFDVQVRFLVSGRPVALEGFVDSILAEITRRVRGEVQGLPQGRLAAQGFPWPANEGERKEPKRLAVGVDEAAKLLGVSPFTIRNHIASGSIRVVRVGRRVLVPMEVLEKVMAEGLGKCRS